MAVRMLWNFVVGRAKVFIKNYNVLERSEKVMEGDKRVPPRHPGTEAKFKVLIKERAEMIDDMEKKPIELLDRLKVVKVTSENVSQDDETDTRPLPQSRMHQPLPTYGYEEPKSVPEGKCTLRQALDFISKHQNDPSTYSITTIAKENKMNVSDVESILNNFRAFQLYIARDEKVNIAKSAMKILGANKIEQSLYRKKNENMDEETKITAKVEVKK